MKTLYISLLTGLLIAGTTKAQLTLLPENHEPKANEMDGYKLYDSTNAVPNATGANLTWDFSAMTMKAGAAKTETFSNVSSVPASSMFPGATLAGTKDNVTWNFYKSTAAPATFEKVGEYSSTSKMNYSNGMIHYAWPISYGTSWTDTYGGTETGPPYANFTGTANTSASGNGTLIMPGGGMYTNVLQVKTTDMMMMSDTISPITTSTIMATTYKYFHTSQKFPLITVWYEHAALDSVNTSHSAEIRVNYLLAVGINDNNLDASFAIYPNPSKDNFNVKLTNTNNESCTITIFNSLGQQVKAQSLGNASSIEENISVKELGTGIYIVKTTLGNRSSARRLIVE